MRFANATMRFANFARDSQIGYVTHAIRRRNLICAVYLTERQDVQEFNLGKEAGESFMDPNEEEDVGDLEEIMGTGEEQQQEETGEEQQQQQQEQASASTSTSRASMRQKGLDVHGMPRRKEVGLPEELAGKFLILFSVTLLCQVK